MPKKTAPTSRTWTAEEIDLLRASFAGTTNKDLAAQFERSERSIANQGAALGLRKHPSHRSEQSRRTALACVDVDHMKLIGSSGGKKGGVVRMKGLTRKERVELGHRGGRASSKARKRRLQESSSPGAPVPGKRSG